MDPELVLVSNFFPIEPHAWSSPFPPLRSFLHFRIRNMDNNIHVLSGTLSVRESWARFGTFFLAAWEEIACDRTPPEAARFLPPVG